MNTSFKLAALAGVMALFSNNVFAEVVNFDSPIPAGVTVNYINNTGGVLAALPTVNTNPLAFTSSAIPGGGQALLLQPFGALFTFSSLQSFVSMVGNDFGGTNPTDNEEVYLSVFGASGNLLGSTTVHDAYAVPNLQPISISAAGIKYAAFTFSSDLGYYAVDNVETVAAVPEPETYAMLFAGLGMLALAKRRRSKAAA